jgi:hypothetical protein
MSVVWRAHDDVLNRAVAVKVLAPDQRVDAAARRRVQSEARAAAALSHPNVAAVHDYGEAPGQSGEPVPYVVMELVDGPTLTEVLTDGPLDPAEAMRICADVAAGLAAIHARGLVHRDVKPGNVIVNADGAKLVDFGIAASIGEPDEVGEDGIMYGTPAYLAPERLEDGVVVPGSDVYALGLLLYRLLAGKTPWSAETTIQMLRAHAYLPPRPLPDIDGVPAEVADLCRRCLAKDPVERPTAAEAAACLTASGRTAPAPRPAVPVPGDRGSDAGAVADSDSPPTADPADPAGATGATGDPTDTAATRRGRRRRTAIAVAIAVLVTSLCLLSLWHFNPLTDRPRSAAPGAGGSLPGSGATARETDGGSGTAPNGPGGRASGGDPRAADDPPAGTTTGPGAGGNTTTPSAPGTSPAPAPARRSVNTTGGSAEVECVGTMAHLISWTPAAGYETQTVQEGPKQSVHVIFRSGNKHVNIQAKCTNGVPDVTVH